MFSKRYVLNNHCLINDYKNNKYNFTNVVYPILNSFNFHTSSIICSNVSDNDTLNTGTNYSHDTIYDLQLIKYNETVVESDLPEIVKLSSSDSFPSPAFGSEGSEAKGSVGEGLGAEGAWFKDENGQILAAHVFVNVFESIKLINQYLEKRFDLSADQISNVKISQLLEPFKDREENSITVIELFNHFGKIYNEDKNNLIKGVLSNLAKTEDLKNKNTDIVNSSNLKPFGKTGDKTLYEISVGLSKLHWDVELNTTKVTLQDAPFAMNFVSYSLLLKGYMKYVHNKPYKELSSTEERSLVIQQSIKKKTTNSFFFNHCCSNNPYFTAK